MLIFHKIRDCFNQMNNCRPFKKEVALTFVSDRYFVLRNSQMNPLINIFETTDLLQKDVIGNPQEGRKRTHGHFWDRF